MSENVPRGRSVGVQRLTVTEEAGQRVDNFLLRALPLGPPSPHAERESNSSRDRAQPIDLNGHVLGTIAEENDYDYYRFHVPAKQPVRLQLKAPPESEFGVQLYWDGGTLKRYARIRSDNPLDEVFLLHPGDYYLQVSARPAKISRAADTRSGSRAVASRVAPR